MNLHDYTHILRHPENIGPAETDALDAILTEFPYFQSARALRLKGLRNQDSFRYNFALKITAAYTQDRSVLFDFITSDAFASINRDAAGPIETTAETTVETTDIETAGEPADEIPSELTDETLVETIVGLPETDNSERTEWVTEADEPAAAASIAPAKGSTEERETPEPEPGKDLLAQSIRSSIEKAAVQAAEATPSPAEPEPEPAAEETSDALEKLSVGKPLEFTPTEKHSFSEWLQLAALKPIQREPEPTPEAAPDPEPEADAKDADRQKKIELIDRFIEANPKIAPVKPTSPAPPVVFEPSRAVDNSYLMTETLARVYLEQQKYDKAIQAYEILILKYPEKSSFFADRILDIRSLKKNNTKSE